MAPDHAARPWTAPPRGIVAPVVAALIIGAAVTVAFAADELDRLFDRLAGGERPHRRGVRRG